MLILITNIKTLYKIIYIIIIFSFISSNDDYIINLDGENCVNAPSNPENEEQCTNYNTEETACCYVEIEKIDKTLIHKCVEVERNARFALNYLTIFSLKASDGEEFNDVIGRFKCGQDDKLCGMDHPEEIFQCSEHSSTSRSCCYLSTPTYTECILSDQKYDNGKTFKLFEESTVFCSLNIIKIKWFCLLCVCSFLLI